LELSRNETVMGSGWLVPTISVMTLLGRACPTSKHLEEQCCLLTREGPLLKQTYQCGRRSVWCILLPV
ncbi:hypothetical protein CLOM_g4302, partial [Closterium sp. NIES-68]